MLSIWGSVLVRNLGGSKSNADSMRGSLLSGIRLLLRKRRNHHSGDDMSELHVGTISPRPGLTLPIIDCRSWYVAGREPRCRLALDLSQCESCSSRTSRNGNLADPPIVGRGESTPPHRPAPPRLPVPEVKSGQPMRGLGDVVARATSSIGIKPCGKCKKRQEMLNKLVPFGSAESGTQEEGLTNGTHD